MRARVVCTALLIAAGTARAQEQQGTVGQPGQRDATGQVMPPQSQSTGQVPAQPPTTQIPQQPAAGQLPPQQAAAGQLPPQQPAAGQVAPQAPPLPEQQQAMSDAFERACIDLLHGRTPQGENAIRTLRGACADLMAGKANERIELEKRRQAQAEAREQLKQLAEGRVEPGRAAAPVQQGQGVKAAFEQAATELTDPRRRTLGKGMREGGPVGYTLVTNPVGYFTGLGVNAELFGSFRDMPKFSWITGARYSTTDATNGTATTFGAMGGVDLFIIGRNNAGLRIGPRMEVAAGREKFGSSTTFARLGMSGEVGYNFIASNGITALLGAGIGGRIAGNSKNDQFASFVGGEFGPYINVGLGYSW